MTIYRMIKKRTFGPFELMFSQQAYFADENSRPVLCRNELRELFQLSKEAERVWITVSAEEHHKESIKVWIRHTSCNGWRWSEEDKFYGDLTKRVKSFLYSQDLSQTKSSTCWISIDYEEGSGS